jgi:ELWxxDGT repeat protein
MKKIIYLFCFMLSFFGYSQVSNVSLVEINFSGGGNPRHLTKGTTKLYFTASNEIVTRGLWAHDTVTGETYLVKDIHPEYNDTFGEYNSSFFISGDMLYFLSQQPNNQVELWKSDGTADGTHMIKIINPSGNIVFADVNFFFEYNNLIFFIADNGINGNELWRTDGTEGGTFMVKDINPTTSPYISHISKPIFYNNKFFFSAGDDVYGQELWVSDGTTNGTILFKDINPGENSGNPYNFFVTNGLLFFEAYTDSNGLELWKSDGTPEGTTILKDIYPGFMNGLPFDGGQPIVFNNHFYFFADNGTAGIELWKSDGTEAGTQLFMDIITGSNSSAYKTVGITTDNYFLFTTNIPNSLGYNLWKSDGTVAGTQVLRTLTSAFSWEPTSFEPVRLNNEVYFVAYDESSGKELWKTNGTVNGTILVKDIYPGTNDSNINHLTSIGNILYFAARDSSESYSNKPWRTDGTANGTFMLKNVVLGPSTATEISFVELQGNVFFPAGDEDLHGNELYKTQGTVESTHLVADVFHRYSSYPDHFIKLNNKLIFTAYNGMSERIPFVTDGTISGTKPIKEDYSYYSIPTYSNDIVPKFTKADNNIFFRAFKSGAGFELFKTDGTSNGTVLVKDIAQGSQYGVNEYTIFMEYDNIFYFKANDQIHGEELWRSDGTESGTYMVKDIYPGDISGMFEMTYFYDIYKGHAVLNNYLYFSAQDSQGKGIFKTDGTEAGTVKAIPSLANEYEDSTPIIINATSDKIFYVTTVVSEAGSPPPQNTLWSSNGTAESSVQLLYTPKNSSRKFSQNIVFNDELYFAADMLTSSGQSLYKTDGTAEGTIFLKDNFMPNGYYIKNFVVAGNHVYFTVVNYFDTPKELWRTDGTEDGTVLIEAISDDVSDWFVSLIEVNGHLVFVKYDSAHNKIWYINDEMTTPDFYEINITNSENLNQENHEKINSLFKFNNKLVFTANTLVGGEELYIGDLEGDFFKVGSVTQNTNNNNPFKIYPNPSNGEIFIVSENSIKIDSVEMFDLTGKSVYKENLKTIEGRLNLTGLSPGIYLLTVKSTGTSHTYKIVLK